MKIEIFLIIIGALLLLCVFANKISDRFGIPSLLFFLGMGMLAGSDGIGQINFHDAVITNHIGTVALAFILFSGGLLTKWSAIRPIINRGIILATLGVLITASLVGAFSFYALHLPLSIAVLLGAIISSTDAPAVFSILRDSKFNLKPHLQSLLEFESGSNDPMAVFLLIASIAFITNPERSLTQMSLFFLQQIIFGGILGLAFGKLASAVLGRWCLPYPGLYPVYGIGIVLLIFNLTQILNGSGFLAVYIAGIILGNSKYLYRRHFIRFNDSLAWIMQIGMFLILGLLVNPSELPSVMLTGSLCTLFMIFIARPIAIFICLCNSEYSFKEQLLVSWAGFKGAVPIILATYPLMKGMPQSQYLFNLIFFLVLISVLFQGQTISFLARKLNLEKENAPQN